MFNFHHVALSVNDLEVSKLFYAKLGFATAHEWSSDDGNESIVHLKCNDVILELFYYAQREDADTSKDLHEGLRVIGLKHFAMRVVSIHNAFKDLQKKGIPPVTDIDDGRTGIQYFFIKDPDGNFVEVVQDDRELD